MSESKPKPEGEHPIPKAVVSRLSLYLRELQGLIRNGQPTTSSTQLGAMLGFTDAQVRKDLAYFGQFGYPGIGYRCDELVTAIRQILGTNQRWPVAIVGIGNLGRALLGYRGFDQQGFAIAAALDADPSKAGKVIDGVTVEPMAQLAEIVRQRGIKLAIVAVPSAQAQGVADQLAAAGIDGILNFAPVTLTLPKEVRRIDVDLAIELEQLAFAVVSRERNG